MKQIILMLCLLNELLAQRPSTPESISSGQQVLPIVGNVSVVYSGEASGANTNYCYFVIAKFPIGDSQPSKPQCVNVGQTGGVTIIWVQPSLAATAQYITGYDVIRATNHTFPAGTCSSCLVAGATATLAAIDSLGALSSYTTNAYSPGVSTLTADNINTEHTVGNSTYEGVRSQANFRSGPSLPAYCNTGDEFNVTTRSVPQGVTIRPVPQGVFFCSNNAWVNSASIAGVEINASDFGVVSGTDVTANLQNALYAACPMIAKQCVHSLGLNPGTYTISNQLNLYGSGYPFDLLRFHCITGGVSQRGGCWIKYYGPSKSNAIRMIGYAMTIDNISVEDENPTGWIAGISYDGDAAIGISSENLWNNLFVSCNNLPGDGIEFGANHYQADQLETNNINVTACNGGSALNILDSNAVSIVFNKPAISFNQVGLKTTSSVNVTIFGGEFDYNDLNFYPGCGTVVLIQGVRSEGSKRQLYSQIALAPQMVSFVAYTEASFIYTRIATNTTASIGATSIVVSVANSLAIGDNISISGAGSSGALRAKITGATNSTTFTISTPIVSSVTGAAITLNGQQDQFIEQSTGPYTHTGCLFGSTADNLHNSTFQGVIAYAGIQTIVFTGNSFEGMVVNPFGANYLPSGAKSIGNTYDAGELFGGPFEMPSL